MVLERLFDNLELRVEPFAVCVLSDGWRLNLPDPDWVTLHFVLEGECVLTTGGRNPLAMTEHSLAVVPPRRLHAIECGPPVEHEIVAGGDAVSPCSLTQFAAGDEGPVFRAACGRIQATLGGAMDLFGSMRDSLVLDFSDDARVRGIFAALIEEEQNASPGSRAMITALMNQCLVAIFRKLGERAPEELPWLASLEDPRLAPAIDQVLADPGRPHTLESLARAAGMSRSSFAEHFHDGTGRTPMDFVREVRIREGAKLLKSSPLSVEGVAHRVGFASRSHFTRAFRGYFDQAPAEFRAG